MGSCSGSPPVPPVGVALAQILTTFRHARSGSTCCTSRPNSPRDEHRPGFFERFDGTRNYFQSARTMYQAGKLATYLIPIATFRIHEISSDVGTVLLSRSEIRSLSLDTAYSVKRVMESMNLLFVSETPTQEKKEARTDSIRSASLLYFPNTQLARDDGLKYPSSRISSIRSRISGVYSLRFDMSKTPSPVGAGTYDLIK